MFVISKINKLVRGNSTGNSHCNEVRRSTRPINSAHSFIHDTHGNNIVIIEADVTIPCRPSFRKSSKKTVQSIGNLIHSFAQINSAVHTEDNALFHPTIEIIQVVNRKRQTHIVNSQIRIPQAQLINKNLTHNATVWIGPSLRRRGSTYTCNNSKRILTNVVQCFP